MPKAKPKWKLVNGELVEIKEQVVRAPMRAGGERLTDGLTSMTPLAVSMRAPQRKQENPVANRIFGSMQFAAEKKKITKSLQAEGRSRSGLPISRSPSSSVSPSPSRRSSSSSSQQSNSSVSKPPRVRSKPTTVVTPQSNSRIAPPPIARATQPPPSSAKATLSRPPVVKNKIAPPPSSSDAIKRPKVDSQPPPEETSLPPTSMLALMRKKALEETQERMLPPRLFCIPASVSGNCVVLPNSVKEIVEEKEGVSDNKFFEIRTGTKTARIVATSWRAPETNIGLSPHLMKTLNLKCNDFVLFKKIPPIPNVTSLTIEVTETTFSKGVGVLNSLLPSHLRSWGCLEVNDKLKVDGMRLKIKKLEPSPAFFGAKLPEITYAVKQQVQKVPEVVASAHHTETTRTVGDIVKITVPYNETGTLRVAAKTFDGKPASAIIYIGVGDDLPTPDSFKWGGSDSVDCPFQGKTTFHAKIIGNCCHIHASVLHLGQLKADMPTSSKVQDSMPDYSQSILSYFKSRDYVPSPSEVEARLPADVDLTYLNCFESLLLIGKRPGSYFDPPYAVEWSQRLRHRLTLLPVYLRLALAVHLPSLPENTDFPTYLTDLATELSSAKGADTVLLLLRSLASDHFQVRKNAAAILRWIGGKHLDLSKD